MIKNKLKNLLYPIKKRHLGGVFNKKAFDLNYVSELKAIRDLVYKPEARRAYAKILDSSKQMEKALKKGDDILFRDFDRLRKRDLDQFNSLVKKLNKYLRKNHLKNKPIRGYNYMEGFIKKPRKTIVFGKSFDKHFNLASKGLRVKPLKIPKKYRFNKFGPSMRDQGWGKLA